jgi:hypothetical protein
MEHVRHGCPMESCPSPVLDELDEVVAFYRDRVGLSEIGRSRQVSDRRRSGDTMLVLKSARGWDLLRTPAGA